MTRHIDFQDGGHRVGNLLPGSVLVMALVWEDGNVLAYQILTR